MVVFLEASVFKSYVEQSVVVGFGSGWCWLYRVLGYRIVPFSLKPQQLESSGIKSVEQYIWSNYSDLTRRPSPLVAWLITNHGLGSHPTILGNTHNITTLLTTRMILGFSVFEGPNQFGKNKPRHTSRSVSFRQPRLPAGRSPGAKRSLHPRSFCWWVEVLAYWLGGWTNPFEKYSSNWIISPGFGVKIKHLWNHHPA